MTQNQKMYLLEYWSMENCGWKAVDGIPVDHNPEYLRRFISHVPEGVQNMYRVRDVDEGKERVQKMMADYNSKMSYAHNQDFTWRVHDQFRNLSAYRVLLVDPDLATLNNKLIREHRIDIVELNAGFYLYKINDVDRNNSDLVYCGHYPQDVWVTAQALSARLSKGK